MISCRYAFIIDKCRRELEVNNNDHLLLSSDAVLVDEREGGGGRRLNTGQFGGVDHDVGSPT